MLSARFVIDVMDEEDNGDVHINTIGGPGEVDMYKACVTFLNACAARSEYGLEKFIDEVVRQARQLEPPPEEVVQPTMSEN